MPQDKLLMGITELKEEGVITGTKKFKLTGELLEKAKGRIIKRK
jgi:hypothetical protein